jgi:hypothetical protein
MLLASYGRDPEEGISKQPQGQEQPMMGGGGGGGPPMQASGVEQTGNIPQFENKARTNDQAVGQMI